METGIVAERKNLKRNKIISCVRYHSEVSRLDVKKITGYSMTTVLTIIEELLQRKLLTEEECTTARAGRKPTWLNINAKGAYAVGVEFNAELLTCCVVDFSYEVIFNCQCEMSCDDTAEMVVNKIVDSVRKALDYLGRERSERVLGIGLGIPGYLNRESGTLLKYAHIRALQDLPLKERIEKELGFPVLIENNINTMALAYRWNTYQETSEDFVFLSMKHGTRMGSFIANHLLLGNGNAGEIGHIRLANGSRYCSCGRRGCLDTEVSAKAIRNKIAERMECGQFGRIAVLCGNDRSKITVQMLVDEARAGNAEAISLLDETAQWLSQCLSGMIATLNPSRLIIASQSGLGGKLFSDMLFCHLKETTTPVLLKDFCVECIKVSDNMGAFGAAMLLLENEFQVIDGTV